MPWITLGWFALAIVAVGGIGLAGRAGMLSSGVRLPRVRRRSPLRMRVALPRRARIDGELPTAVAIVLGTVALALLITTRGPGLLGGVPLWLVPLVLIPLLILPVWMAASRRYHVALAVLLLYIGLVDGVLKLQSSSELPGLGRDLLFYAIAIGMLVRLVLRRRSAELPPLSAWVLAFSAVVLVQLANPGNGSLLHSVASLRQHLEFVPLFFIAFTVMRSTSRLRAFFLLLALVGAVNGVVGSVQLGLSPEQLSAWGPGYERLLNGDDLGGTGAPRTAEDADGNKVVRPPGLGSDMGFAGVIGGMAIPGAIALAVASRRRRRREQVLAAVLLAACIAGVATSLSRSAVISGVVGVLAFACLVAVARPRKIPAVFAMLVLFTGLATAVGVYVSQGREGSFERLSSITPDRAVGTAVDSRSSTLSAIPIYVREFPLGAGIGSVGPAAGVIDPPPPRFLNAESQFTFMLVELGVPGLLVFLAFQAALLGMVLRWIRRTATFELALLLAALAAPLFASIALWVVGVVTVSTPNNAYLWFAAGTLAFWMRPRAPDREVRRASRPARVERPPVPIGR